MDPRHIFHAPAYVEHNARRLEHLASLNLHLGGKTVLEMGAGIGDHTEWLLREGCSVTCVEPRMENIRFLRQRFPRVDILPWNLDRLPDLPFDRVDVVYAYGILYHLNKPAEAIEYFAKCAPFLLLETCIDDKCNGPNFVTEGESPSQAYNGVGCRPARSWVWEKLQASFSYVYVTTTQPKHPEFPLDWSCPAEGLNRAVFVASQSPVYNSRLSDQLLEQHEVW